MKKRVLCALCAAAILATGAMAGCSGGGQASTNDAPAASQADNSEQPKDDAESKAEDGGNTAAVTDGTLKGLKATKIGRVKVDASVVNFNEGAIIYQSSGGKFGVISLDGSKDTGAKYALADQLYSSDSSSYTIARTHDITNDNLNTAGLIDKNGEEIIEFKYATFERIGSRYVAAYTADKKTENKDEAILSISKYGTVSTYPDDEGTNFTGKIEIFDLKNKALLKGVTPKTKGTMYSYGQFVSYYDANDRRITVDAKGVEVTDGRTIFDNGAYVLEVNGKSAVYDTDENRLFNFDSKDFEVKYYYAPYYVGVTSDGQYVLLNDSGEKVSALFNQMPDSITADFVVIENKIFELDGTQLFEGYKSIYYDSVNKDAYYATNSSTEDIIFFTKDGNILFKGNTKTDNISANGFTMHQDKNYFNYKDKTFSIKGTIDCGSWLVAQEQGSVQDLIDTRTGEKVVDSYGRFTYTVDRGDKIRYVYAFNSINGQVSRGDFDVYTVATAE